jgi:hypothetical protein
MENLKYNFEYQRLEDDPSASRAFRFSNSFEHSLAGFKMISEKLFLPMAEHLDFDKCN